MGQAVGERPASQRHFSRGFGARTLFGLTRNSVNVRDSYFRPLTSLRTRRPRGFIRCVPLIYFVLSRRHGVCYAYLGSGFFFFVVVSGVVSVFGLV